MLKKLIFLAILVSLSVPIFAQSVDTAWVRRYDGPFSSGDYSHAITVDTSGNIYVTGESYGSGTSRDYATIKYYPNGDTAWVRRYDGPGNGADYARDIVLDALGNVYITGKSYGGIGEGYDCATIKYDSEGNEEWIERFGGEANLDDEAYAIALDVHGNVFITGRVQVKEFSFTIDICNTIKYSPAGDTIWVREYAGPSFIDAGFDVVVDDSGNAYVAGAGMDGLIFTYLTIKYSSDGNREWVKQYNHWLANLARGVAIDRYGDIYVTGWSADSLFSYDYATVKYNSEGDQEWVRRYNNLLADSTDEATNITTDANGNVYVTGTSYNFATNYDYLTIKYNTHGDTAWIRRYNGIGTSDDSALAIAVDASGYVYVTGHSADDYLTIKYNRDGDTVWTTRYNGPEDSEDGANAIACYCGNVYVTGASRGSGTSYDYATIKYVQDIGRGDVNGSGSITISDVISLASYMFKNGTPPDPLDKGDCNCDCNISVGDIVYLINYLFKSGPAPRKYCK